MVDCVLQIGQKTRRTSRIQPNWLNSASLILRPIIISLGNVLIAKRIKQQHEKYFSTQVKNTLLIKKNISIYTNLVVPPLTSEYPKLTNRIHRIGANRVASVNPTCQIIAAHTTSSMLK